MDVRHRASTHQVEVAAWRICASPVQTRCQRCRGAIYEGELIAVAPGTGRALHPSCAGSASHGAVVTAPQERVTPRAA